MLHLDGSTRMWMLRVAGGRQIVRDRDAEFAERGPLRQVGAARAVALDTRRSGRSARDARTSRHCWSVVRRTQGEVTVLWAVLHGVEHFAMHTGQIITLTKLRTGSALRLTD